MSPASSTIDQEYQQALRHHQQGQLSHAEALYRRVLAAQPNHAGAMHFLGVIAHQVGRHEAAVDLMGRSIALAPNQAQFYSNHAEALRALGRPREAIDALRRALALEPNDCDFHSNLGIALLDCGELAAAEASLRQAAAIDPRRPEPVLHWSRVIQARGNPEAALPLARRAVELSPGHLNSILNLALLLRMLGRLDEALSHCRQAITLHPDAEGAHSTLGLVLAAMKQFGEAARAYQRGTELKPLSAMAHAGLGSSLAELGQNDAALASLHRAIQLAPPDPSVRNTIGLSLLRLDRPQDAREQFRAALRVKPDSAEFLNHLSVALEATGEMDEALAALERAVALNPDHGMSRSNLGKQLSISGRSELAIPHLRRAIELMPDDPRIGSNLLLELHYASELAPRQILQEHLDWVQRHATPLASQICWHDNDRDPGRRLRIGYLSPDLRAHAVADFLEPILAAHDKANFEIVCFSDVRQPDLYTQRLRTYPDHWVDVAGRSDEDVAEQIRARRIDILVDLAGHTANNRLLVFARKPAPVQVTYLGYPDTTGLPTIDWRITDSVADPITESESLHTERLYRLSRTFLTYRPYPESPDVGPLPADASGHVTFASFNNLSKVTPRMIETWAKLLHASPGSRLLIKASALVGPAKQRLIELLASHGIGPERFELIGRIKEFHDHLALYNRVDVALDTFPYHGTTTTCEALWMGVPVVTLEGRVHSSRVGVSLLAQVGLTDLVARDLDDYVRKAAALASDCDRLRELRAGLRDRVRRSPLLDGAGVTRELEAAYRDMWKQWVNTEHASC